MRTCLNQLTMNNVTVLFRRLTREFASAKTNATEKYREEKMKVNGPGKRKLGQGRHYGTD